MKINASNVMDDDVTPMTTETVMVEKKAEEDGGVIEVTDKNANVYMGDTKKKIDKTGDVSSEKVEKKPRRVRDDLEVKFHAPSFGHQSFNARDSAKMLPLDEERELHVPSSMRSGNSSPPPLGSRFGQNMMGRRHSVDSNIGRSRPPTFVRTYREVKWKRVSKQAKLQPITRTSSSSNLLAAPAAASPSGGGEGDQSREYITGTHIIRQRVPIFMTSGDNPDMSGRRFSSGELIPLTGPGHRWAHNGKCLVIRDILPSKLAETSGSDESSSSGGSTPTSSSEDINCSLSSVDSRHSKKATDDFSLVDDDELTDEATDEDEGEAHEHAHLTETTTPDPSHETDLEGSNQMLDSTKLFDLRRLAMENSFHKKAMTTQPETLRGLDNVSKLQQSALSHDNMSALSVVAQVVGQTFTSSGELKTGDTSSTLSSVVPTEAAETVQATTLSGEIVGRDQSSILSDIVSAVKHLPTLESILSTAVPSVATLISHLGGPSTATEPALVSLLAQQTAAVLEPFIKFNASSPVMSHPPAPSTSSQPEVVLISPEQTVAVSCAAQSAVALSSQTVEVSAEHLLQNVSHVSEPRVLKDHPAAPMSDVVPTTQTSSTPEAVQVVDTSARHGTPPGPGEEATWVMTSTKIAGANVYVSASSQPASHTTYRSAHWVSPRSVQGTLPLNLNGAAPDRLEVVSVLTPGASEPLKFNKISYSSGCIIASAQWVAPEVPQQSAPDTLSSSLSAIFSSNTAPPLSSKRKSSTRSNKRWRRKCVGKNLSTLSHYNTSLVVSSPKPSTANSSVVAKSSLGEMHNEGPTVDTFSSVETSHKSAAEKVVNNPLIKQDSSLLESQASSTAKSGKQRFVVEKVHDDPHIRQEVWTQDASPPKSEQPRFLVENVHNDLHIKDLSMQDAPTLKSEQLISLIEKVQCLSSDKTVSNVATSNNLTKTPVAEFTITDKINCSAGMSRPESSPGPANNHISKHEAFIENVSLLTLASVGAMKYNTTSPRSWTPRRGPRRIYSTTRVPKSLRSLGMRTSGSLTSPAVVDRLPTQPRRAASYSAADAHLRNGSTESHQQLDCSNDKRSQSLDLINQQDYSNSGKFELSVGDAKEQDCPDISRSELSVVISKQQDYPNTDIHKLSLDIDNQQEHSSKILDTGQENHHLRETLHRSTMIQLDGDGANEHLQVTHKNVRVESDCHGTNDQDSHGINDQVQAVIHNNVRVESNSHGTNDQVQTVTHNKRVESDSHGTNDQDSHGTNDQVQTVTHNKRVESDSHGTNYQVQTVTHNKRVESDSHSTNDQDSHGTNDQVQTVTHNKRVESDSHGTNDQVQTVTHNNVRVESVSHGTNDQVQTVTHTKVRTDIKSCHGTNKHLQTVTHTKLITDSDEDAKFAEENDGLVQLILISLSDTDEADGLHKQNGGGSTVAIDNKIEQAMDLVKRHLMYAVREEVEILKQQIGEMMERIGQLEYENTVLRSEAKPETLSKLQQPPVTQSAQAALSTQPAAVVVVSPASQQPTTAASQPAGAQQQQQQAVGSQLGQPPSTT